MLGYLRGKIVLKDENILVVETNGVGYQVHVLPEVLLSFQEGQEISLYLHTSVRENAIDLFGFQSVFDKKVFLLLNSASGIGPKTAIGVLQLGAKNILDAIVRGDKSTLSQAQGVGKKTAEKVIVELSDKASALLLSTGGSETRSRSLKTESSSNKQSSDENANWIEAIAALVHLGYSEKESAEVVSEVMKASEEMKGTEEIVRRSLQQLSRQRMANV
ncbi:MAG: Holliday junction branch migration protein RuvA [Bacteriovoracia bacterium]